MATKILAQSKTPAPRQPAAPRRRKGVAAVPAQDAFPHDDAEPWGHLGVRLSGDEFSRWYPLSQEQAGSVIQQLSAGAPWVAVSTLNNRALLIQPSALQRLLILDSDADEPADDWRLSWSDECGLGDAVYRGLWACYLDGSAEGINGAPELRAKIRRLVALRDLDERALHDLLRATRLHHRDGAASALRLDGQASWDLFAAVQQGHTLPPVLLLACWGEGLDYYAPQDQVALVDMPLHLMREAQMAEHDEFDRAADDWRLSLAA